jgi:hypothetical protein
MTLTRILSEVLFDEADLFTQNLIRYREGRPLLNRITPQDWREA